MERAAAAGFALDPDAAAKQLDQLARDGQPDPAPPWLRVVEASTCVNASKMRPRSPAAMPMPVSVTGAMQISPGATELMAARTAMPPCSVSSRSR